MKVTAVISQSITGPRLVRWREAHRAIRSDVRTVPFKVAMYLELIPSNDYTGFTNKLYSLTNKELSELTTDAAQTVSRRMGRTYVTFNV